MIRTQLIETPIIVVNTNVPQKVLSQDDRRIYAGFWPSQQGSTTYITTNPQNLSNSFTPNAPAVFGTQVIGPTWELHIARQAGLVKREWWIMPTGMAAAYIGTVFELLQWDDGFAEIVPPPFADTTHLLVPGIDVPDQLTELVNQLKRRQWKR